MLRKEVAAQKEQLERLTRQIESLTTGRAGKAASTAASGTASEKRKSESVKTNAGLSPADESQTVTAQTKIRDLESEFRVPTSPAATALGLNPDTMPRAQIPRELGILNINGVDLRGNEQTGLAVDIAVGQLVNLNRGDRGLTAGDYSDGAAGVFTLDPYEQWAYWRRVLTRTQLSLAGTRGTSDKDKSVRIAMGFNLPLMVSRDVVQTSFLNGRTDGSRTLNGEKTPAKARPFTSAGTTAALGNTLWEHLDWTVGGFITTAAEQGGNDNFRYGGSTVMSTWNFSLQKPGPDEEGKFLKYLSFVAGVTYRDHELVPLSSTSKVGAAAGSSSLIGQNSLTLGGGVRVGTADLNATAFYEWINLHDASRNSQANRYGVVAEYQLPNSNFWLTATAGEEIGDDRRPSSSFVLGGVKVGLGGDSFTKPAGQ